MITIVDIHAFVREIPLILPFATSQDSQPRTVTRPICINFQLSDGTSSQSESVPVQYVTGETEDSLLSTIKFASERLRGSDAERWNYNLSALRIAFPDQHSALAGIEMAYFQWLATSAGVPLWKYFGGHLENIETDITISLSSDAPERARDAVSLGFNSLKIKIGSGSALIDYDNIKKILDLAPNATLRVDANQAFEPVEALKFSDLCSTGNLPIEFIEQPVNKYDFDGIDFVAQNSPIPIFADEAVITAADALRIVSETSVHGINIKLMKSGIRGALDIIAIAKAANRKLMLGCMLESRAGIAVSLALACGTGAFDYIDLDSHRLLKEVGANLHFYEAGPVMGFTSKQN